MWRWLVVAILVLPAVSAIDLIDAQTGEQLQTGYVRIEGETVREFFLTPEYRGPETAPNGTLLLRTTDSGTFDHYAHLTGGERVVLVHPAGVLVGDVEDNFASSIVHAPIVIDCLTQHMSTQTDAMGKFRITLPAETCRITVMSDGRSGDAVVDITQGEITDVTVLVGIVNTKNLSWMLAIALCIAVVVVVFILRTKTRAVRTGATSTTRTPIKAALTQKERQVVDAVSARGGKMTLRELRFVLQLPRTSLLRTLQSLESREVLIRTQEHGRILVELNKP